MFRIIIGAILLFGSAQARHSYPDVNLKQEALRDYYAGYTQEDKKNWKFILTTLSNKPLTKLLTLRPKLKSAGAKINHVHPLQLLCCAFSDDSLKVALRNLQSRGGFVWGEFISDIGNSFNEELSHNNMRDEFIHDFSLNVKIDIDVIYSSIQQRNWGKFINLLIDHLPRDNSSDPWDD